MNSLMRRKGGTALFVQETGVGQFVKLLCSFIGSNIKLTKRFKFINKSKIVAIIDVTTKIRNKNKNIFKFYSFYIKYFLFSNLKIKFNIFR